MWPSIPSLHEFLRSSAALGGNQKCDESRHYPLGGFLLSYPLAGRRESGTKHRAERRAGYANSDKITRQREISVSLPFGITRNIERRWLLPSFFFLFPSPRPLSSGCNWADDLNARTTTNGSPRWYLTARRRSVSRASTGRRFAVCGPCASASFVGNLDGSFSADVTVLGRVWARNVPSENSNTSISITIINNYYLNIIFNSYINNLSETLQYSAVSKFGIYTLSPLL